MYYDICERPKEVRTTICKYVIKRLTSKNKIHNNLYMNYLAFSVQESCINVKIWTKDVLFDLPVMNCFDRFAIMSSESSEEMVDLYQKIVIYPSNVQSLLIFKYNKDKNYYNIVDKYDIKWNKIRSMSVSLFSTPMPQGWRHLPHLF